MTESTKKLEPCPYCGEAPEIEETVDLGRLCFYPYCKKCEPDYVGIAMTYTKKSSATRGWNRSAIAALVEAQAVKL